MKTFKVTPESAASIENRAIAFLNIHQPEMLSSMKPLDVERILDVSLEAHYGYTVDVRETLAFNVEGYIDPRSKTLVIPEETYQKLSTDGRSRYTACHEFGHVELHRDEVAKIMAANDESEARLHRKNRFELKPYEDAEWQANCFAAAILMPKRHVTKLYAESGFDYSGTIQKLMEVFVVSYQAASIRLRQVIKKAAR